MLKRKCFINQHIQPTLKIQLPMKNISERQRIILSERRFSTSLILRYIMFMPNVDVIIIAKKFGNFVTWISWNGIVFILYFAFSYFSVMTAFWALVLLETKDSIFNFVSSIVDSKYRNFYFIFTHELLCHRKLWSSLHYF